jgi:hypothetical protein
MPPQPPARHYLEKDPMPANHARGPIRTTSPTYFLHHQHGPTPDGQRLPTAYTIYVDGGWDTVNADFTAFQEQRDPTNRRGSAGIAIVLTGPDWMNKGTILMTLTDGSQTGTQPAYM